jgi:asparagine synthase (glutamine-hydrolysing)
MCGIAGVFRYGSDRPIDPSVLSEMVRRMRHRGPDDDGLHVSPRVGLAHTRLSIIDLSPMGHQPFLDEARQVALSYNGEIYNYKELRTWLEGRGHRFRSRTDTEVVLRCYLELGPRCVERLIGMFAFAIWDARSETLFLARDRIGEKPLVYADVDGSFTFASEIHALLADPDVPRTPDEIGLLSFLGTGKCVPFPRTAFARVKKLPPGHTLTVRRDGLTLERYWAPDFGRKTRVDLDGAIEQLDAVLSATVSSMMMSDVPIGLLLSGGVDSSTIAFDMRRCTDNMRTFACGASARDEELLRARAVAARLGTSHAEHVFALRPETILRVLDRFGEPISEPSVIYRMQMCEFVRRQGITVVLTGDGGDEVFGGYAAYSLLRRYPGVKRLLARVLAGGSPLRALPGVDARLVPRVEAHRAPVAEALGDALARKMRGNLERLGCAHPEAEGAIDEVRSTLVGWLQAARVTDVIDGALFADLMLTLHHNHVMIPDAVGMSQSLEIRSPFLDARVVEFAASLPPEYKVTRDPSGNKRILKRLLERQLPDDLVYADKIGYGGNIRFLAQHPELWESLFEGLLRSGEIAEAGLAAPPALRRLAGLGSAADSFEQIARLSVLMLGLWLDQSQGSGRIARSLGDAIPATAQGS